MVEYKVVPITPEGFRLPELSQRLPCNDNTDFLSVRNFSANIESRYKINEWIYCNRLCPASTRWNSSVRKKMQALQSVLEMLLGGCFETALKKK